MIFSINNSIVYYNSGIEHAEFKRTQLFHRYHQPTRILTDDWDPSLHYYLHRIGIPDRDVVNMYDYYQHAQHVKSRRLHLDDLSIVKRGQLHISNNYRQVKYGGNVYYVYFSGLPGQNDRVTQVDCFHDDQCRYSDYYDLRGFLSRRMIFSDTSKYESGERFFTPSGRVAFKKVMHHDLKTGNYYPHYYVWGSHHSLVGRDQLILHFLNLLCLQNESLYHPVILVADRWWRNRTVDNLLDRIKYPHYLAFYSHYSHVQDDKKPLTAHTDDRFNHIFKQAHQVPSSSSYDSLICSTARQGYDIKRRYHLPRKIFTVPVGIQDETDVKDRLPMRQRFSWQITCVTRVDPVEGLLDTIKAFGLAREQLPQLSLDIYGKMGAFKPKFAKQLKNLKQKYRLNDNNFTVHKYTTQVPQVYRRSQLTLVTSKSDAFNISLLEALSQGCPAIVYTDNYGPRDMIQNGYNGYLVNNDYRKMARQIVFLFKHPQLLQAMSNHAYLSSENYSPKQVWLKWQKVIADAKRVWSDKLLLN